MKYKLHLVEMGQTFTLSNKKQAMEMFGRMLDPTIHKKFRVQVTMER